MQRNTQYSTLNQSQDESKSGHEGTYVRILGFANQAGKQSFIVDNKDIVKVRFDKGHQYVHVLEGEINYQALYQPLVQKNWKEKFQDILKPSTPDIAAYNFKKDTSGQIYVKKVSNSEFSKVDTSDKFDFGKKPQTY